MVSYKVGDKVTLEDHIYDLRLKMYCKVIRRGKITKVEEYHNEWMGFGYTVWADYDGREIGVAEDDPRLSKGFVGLLRYALLRLLATP